GAGRLVGDAGRGAGATQGHALALAATPIPGPSGIGHVPQREGPGGWTREVPVPLERRVAAHQATCSSRPRITRILPSPMRPVRAWTTMALMAAGTSASSKKRVSSTLGRNEALYSLPR